ncbi:hypothetical protein COB57_00590 [Candidatus Peregrinibacteria bacterium]|nr:MAG: hypothetical protein COB57_00590 [Candidatus Peregrinibacteria bacterium]
MKLTEAQDFLLEENFLAHADPRNDFPFEEVVIDDSMRKILKKIIPELVLPEQELLKNIMRFSQTGFVYKGDEVSSIEEVSAESIASDYGITIPMAQEKLRDLISSLYAFQRKEGRSRAVKFEKKEGVGVILDDGDAKIIHNIMKEKIDLIKNQGERDFEVSNIDDLIGVVHNLQVVVDLSTLLTGLSKELRYKDLCILVLLWNSPHKQLLTLKQLQLQNNLKTCVFSEKREFTYSESVVRDHFM